MGYEIATAQWDARLSRHNSEKDKEHDQLWEKFIREVDEIVAKSEYREIGLHPVGYYGETMGYHGEG